MHYFIFSEKDATIYEDSIHQNCGLDQILELQKQLIHAHGDMPYNSRILMQFDLDDFSASLASGDTSGSDMKYYLNLSTDEAVEIPVTYSVYVYPVSQSWQMGNGKRADIPVTTTGVSWNLRDGVTISGVTGSAWASGSAGGPGGAYFSGTLAEPTKYQASQSFNYQTTDLHINVTNIVESWLSGSIQNFGFLIKRDNAAEQSILNQGNLQFFSKETHTIYRPRLEVVWEDYAYSPYTTSSISESVSGSSTDTTKTTNPILYYTTSSFYTGSGIGTDTGYFTQSGFPNTWYSESYSWVTESIWSYTSSLGLYHSSSVTYTFTTASFDTYTSASETWISSSITASTTAVQYYTASLGSEYSASDPGWQSYTVSVSSWSDVTYGNGIFVAVSWGDTDVMTSIDGMSWTYHTASEANSWWGLAYGNNTFVAVSRDGTTRSMYSIDTGQTWTGSLTPEQNRLEGLTYGSSSFVAVASDGTSRVITSPDGITWTSQSNIPQKQWEGITYDGNQFVAVGSSTYTMVSSNAITWITGSDTQTFHNVVYGNGLYIAVGGNEIASSIDGLTWTTRKSVAGNNWYDVAYGNGLFVTISYSGTYRIATSSDGINWTLVTAPENLQWYGITYGFDRFVAVGELGTDLVMDYVWPVKLYYSIAQPGLTGSDAMWAFDIGSGVYSSQSFSAATASYSWTSSSLSSSISNSTATTQLMYAVPGENYVIYLDNLQDEYVQNSKVKFRINARDRYPRKTFVTESWSYTRDTYFLSSSYYAIRDAWTEDEVMPWSTYTQISVDATGSYFNLHLNGMEPERLYRILFKVKKDNIETVYDKNYTFRIIR